MEYFPSAFVVGGIIGGYSNTQVFELLRIGPLLNYLCVSIRCVYAMVVRPTFLCARLGTRPALARLGPGLFESGHILPAPIWALHPFGAG